MKNTLTINASENCLCECLDRVNDGSNSIYLVIVTGDVRLPKLTLDGEEIRLQTNTENVVEVPESKFTESAVIEFNYSDSTRTGNTFTITFPDKLEGDLSIKKVDNFVYNAKYTVIGAGGATITVDDTLSLTSENPVQNKVITKKLDEVFQSVSNGKKEVASAITDKGVPTEANAAFSVMADHIRQIETGGGGDKSQIVADILVNDSVITSRDVTCTVDIEIKGEEENAD